MKIILIILSLLIISMCLAWWFMEFLKILLTNSL